MLFKDQFSELLFIAEDDLDSAKIMASHYKPKVEISCFLCQQCAEKALDIYKNNKKTIKRKENLKW